MSEEFDPYQTWLGIAPSERPCDHYRLLGLRRFESDESVIADQADAIMARLRATQVGKRARFSQQLLNEVAAARFCLLNEVTRAAYDAALRSSERHSPRASPENTTATNTVMSRGANDLESSQPILKSGSEINPSAAIQSLGHRNRGFRTSKNKQGTYRIVLISLALATVGIVGFFALTRTGGERHEEAVNTASDVVWESPEARRDDYPIAQDTEGNIVFLPHDGTVTGQIVVQGEGSDSVAQNWHGDKPSIEWRFRTYSLPKLGVFKVFVTYSADKQTAGDSFRIKIDDQERGCAMRPSRPGKFVRDEFHMTIRRNGGHTLTISTDQSHEGKSFRLKSVELVMR